MSGLAPLILPDLPRRAELLGTLCGDAFALGRAVMVPSHDLTASTFDASRYWRRPSWFNTAWLLAVGLEEGGEVEESRALGEAMGRHALASDFAEYVDPHTGAPTARAASAGRPLSRSTGRSPRAPEPRG